MELSPLVSIIVPCYNVQDFLEKCVNSLVAQTYTNLEIILIDDGSIDNTLMICNNLANSDKRIHVIHTSNSGVSHARNIGLSAACGDYILFVDSDDWIDRETCSTAIKIAQRYDVDIVIWSYLREFSTGSKPKLVLGKSEKYFYSDSFQSLHQRLVGLSGEDLSNPEHADSLVPVWGKLYRNTVVKGLKFVDTSIIGNEDAFFNILAFGKSKSAAYIPECYYHYRKTNINSLTTTYTRKIFERWKNLYCEIYNYLEKNNLPPSFYQALLNRITLGLIGLGTNLANCNESLSHKFSELKIVVNDSLYGKAIETLDFSYLPTKWKIFFYFAKRRNITVLYFLLRIINILRKI